MSVLFFLSLSISPFLVYDDFTTNVNVNVNAKRNADKKVPIFSRCCPKGVSEAVHVERHGSRKPSYHTYRHTLSYTYSNIHTLRVELSNT